MVMDDRQRRAMFARLNNRTQPKGIIRTRKTLTTPERTFIADEINKNAKAGKSQKQSVVQAFAKARQRFGSKIPVIKNPPKNLDQKTRSLLFTLLGVAITLKILRTLRS